MRTHDYAMVTGKDARMRMWCSCGKKSHWSESYDAVFRAQDRHADEVARMEVA